MSDTPRGSAPKPAGANGAVPEVNTALLDRDASILAFNLRVLQLAQRSDVPLLERMRYLCIVSSNLDEFFEVRMAEHLSAFKTQEPHAEFTAASFTALSKQALALVDLQYRLFNDALTPAMEREGISVLSHGERSEAQRKWVQQHFAEQVRPMLVPVALDPSHPFPQVANKSLNFIVQLRGKDAFGRSNDIAIVRVPRSLPRLIAVPTRHANRAHEFVSLSSVIRAHLDDLFPGRKVDQFSQFRITRHSELAVDEQEVKNLRTALREGLHQRHFGAAVRIEVSSGCSDMLAERLLKEFDLPPQALYRVHGPVNLVRFMQLPDMIARPNLKHTPHKPSWPHDLRHQHPAASGEREGFFDRLKRGDALVHQPFESFDAVLQLLREAVDDPQVLAIKQTIYRTGADAEMLGLYRKALERGKDLLAVVELKARFDEEANINWAEHLEHAGAQVVYGVVGLKTHAKMLLITRREGNKLVRYGHLSTGNYNPKTAKLYTDIGYFTADPALTSDMDAVFAQVASHSPIDKLRRMWAAPLAMHSKLVKRIDLARLAAAKGARVSIVAKMNALTDLALIQALISAGQAGVQIDLVVRGACMLPAQRQGFTDNIRVRSVVGRFLEHSRVFLFRTGADESLWLSSADWMSRNMHRRVEIAWPIEDERLCRRLINECLLPYLQDQANAWQLMPDGSYQPLWLANSGEGLGLELPAADRRKLQDVHRTLVDQFAKST